MKKVTIRIISNANPTSENSTSRRTAPGASQNLISVPKHGFTQSDKTRLWIQYESMANTMLRIPFHHMFLFWLNLSDQQWQIRSDRNALGPFIIEENICITSCDIAG